MIVRQNVKKMGKNGYFKAKTVKIDTNFTIFTEFCLKIAIFDQFLHILTCYCTSKCGKIGKITEK